MDNKLAFNNVSGDWFQANSLIFDAGYKASADSPRKRIILPIHREQGAAVQRMLNFVQPGTYIRPHRHSADQAIESIVLLRGAIRFFIFDDKGNLKSATRLEAGTTSCIMDIEPNIWHSFIVAEPNTVLFECKKGPYEAMSDKDFAPWAPEEYTHEASEWVKKMEIY